MDKNVFLVDTAAERVYQNQSEEYQKSFTKWRNDPKNRFGYRFVHDSREHTYVDGEGFADEQCRAAELSSLRTCLQFLGGIMLLYFFLEQFSFILLKILFEKVHINWIYFSHLGENQVIAPEEVYLYCVLRLFIIVFVLAVGRIVLKLPLKVMIPTAKQQADKTAYLAAAMAVVALLMRAADLTLSSVMQRVGIDSVFYVYVNSSDTSAQTVYFIAELIVLPVLMELLFRGMILQLFRQFGDYFSILVTACAQAFCYHELSKMMFIFIMSIALNVTVIKTGSIIPAAGMRVVTLNLIYLLNYLSMDRFNNTAHLTEAIISLSVLAAAFTVMFALRIHSKRPYIMEHDFTELDIMTKVKQFVNAPVAVVWVTCTMLATILAVKFI